MLGGKIINNICDMHSHIVPFVDDGSINFEMSLKLLRSAQRQGVRKIVCSSHSWGNIREYYNQFKILRCKAKSNGIKIELYSGCEIYCDINFINDIIDSLEMQELPTINNTNCVLLEFNSNVDLREMVMCIGKINKYGYIPIIAHVERYKNLREYKSIAQALVEQKVCLFQVNAYSLYDETDTSIKNFARWTLSNKLVSFVGSDAHQTGHRPYMIEDGIRYIYDNCDLEYAEEILFKNSNVILQ